MRIRTKTYRTWESMKRRCHSPKSDKFQWYGARGIEVCASWRESFTSFLADMGECPEGMTLDRINNDGNYEPSNCRWATRLSQANNMRSNLAIVVHGETMTVSEASRRFGIRAFTIYRRLDRGWSHERAATEAPLKEWRRGYFRAKRLEKQMEAA